MIQCLEKMSGRPYPGLKETLGRIQQAIKGEAPAAPRTQCTEYTLPYEAIGRGSAEAVGEKNANVAEVLNRVGLRVPRGFAVTTAGFERFMAHNNLAEVVQRLKAKADVIETQTILQVSEQIQLLIGESEVPEDLARAILDALARMGAAAGVNHQPLRVAVRSSAIDRKSVV